MKRTIFVILLVALLVGTTFAGASTITKTKQEYKTDDPQPCPSIVIPPGLWDTNFQPKAKGNAITGYWKHVEKDETFTIKSDLAFTQFGSGAVFTFIDGKLVKIPRRANRIEIIYKERKNGSSWYVVHEETINEGQSNQYGEYDHKYSQNYTDDAKYEIMVSADSYGTTILGDEISWPSGGGKFFTVTVYVGEVKPPKNKVQVFNFFERLQDLFELKTLINFL